MTRVLAALGITAIIVYAAITFDGQPALSAALLVVCALALIIVDATNQRRDTTWSRR